MPVHKITRIIQPALLELRRELEDEWRNQSDRAVAPVIYEVDPGESEPIELYVVWDKWNGIIQSVRSDLILDTFAAIKGGRDIERVGVAMGLTRDEYGRMNLDFDRSAGGSNSQKEAGDPP